MNRLALASAVLLATATLTAQNQLTSAPGFSSNGGGPPGGAMFFDLVSTTDLSILAIDLNFSAAVGTRVGCEFYVRPGTYAGNESTPEGWVQIATDDGSSRAQGRDLPTPLTLTDPVCLNAGRTVGVAIVAVGGGHAYTNGNASNRTAANAVLSFSAGSSSNAPFLGTAFSPRVANITLHYAFGPCTLPVAPRLEGAVDTAAAPGTLSEDGGYFLGGDTLRLRTNDPFGGLVGQNEFLFLNAGPPGFNPLAVTFFLPGFVQRWAASTPPGLDFIVGNLVGNERTLVIPVGFGRPDGTIRIQSLILDLTSSNPVLPATVTGNAVTFTIGVDRANCVATEGFETGFPGTWRTPSGSVAWLVNSGSTTSGGTGPNGAIEGTNYLYCETSAPLGQPNALFQAETDLVTTTGLSFQVSRVGNDIGTLTVELVDAAGTLLPGGPILTLGGSGPMWEQQIVTYADPTVPHRVRFSYVGGVTAQGDLAIDDVCHFR